MEGFTIICNKCAKTIIIPPSILMEADNFKSEHISFYVDVYETLNIDCSCGNSRS
jgi:hypothetical protein